ncbi:MAG: hypothetical protein LBE33_02590 [Zoogloeaceae bacterium]|jgi:hypothetical protein|nr:hypothetical protein [Zoogloeaceae bacterium]
MEIFILLFLAALIGGGIVQRITKSKAASVFLPFLAYVAWSVYHEFFVPYQGGGASFWPIDIFFAGPVAAVGGGVGASLAIKFFGANDDA